jgi:Uma2 family endonuclease
MFSSHQGDRMQTAQETAPPVSRQASPPEMGQRLILHGVSWGTYKRLLADFQDSHAAHFAYDRGVLEIMVLSAKHEELNRAIALLVEILALEMNINVRNLGSTTFTRDDLARGFEPDTCFYIQNAARVRGKEEINLEVDPPPDLVVEIDITHPSLDKLPIYAAVGVLEVWRYDGQQLTIFTLEGEAYHTHEKSVALPGLTSQVLSQFIAESKTLERLEWLRRVQEWARKQMGDDDSSR